MALDYWATHSRLFISMNFDHRFQIFLLENEITNSMKVYTLYSTTFHKIIIYFRSLNWFGLRMYASQHIIPTDTIYRVFHPLCSSFAYYFVRKTIFPKSIVKPKILKKTIEIPMLYERLLLEYRFSFQKISEFSLLKHLLFEILFLLLQFNANILSNLLENKLNHFNLYALDQRFKYFVFFFVLIGISVGLCLIHLRPILSVVFYV